MDEPPLPERHLECSECKKPIHTIYTELVGKTVYKLGMCADCPILRQKLHGGAVVHSPLDSKEAGLVCGGCGTTIDEVRMGAFVGCPLCYEVFEEIIVAELQATKRLHRKMAGVKKVSPLHLGRLPGQPSEVSPAMKLLSLHQALHETLGREDYEQAAWLRDQIRELNKQTKEEGSDSTNAPSS